MTPRELTVYMRDVFAGVLTDLGPGAMRFVYDPHYLTSGGIPLSLSLPIDGSASSKVVRNWFANLLPEGDARVAVSAEARVPVHDDFGLLQAIGRECAGAIGLWPRNEKPPAAFDPVEFELLDEGRLAQWIEFPTRRTLGGGLLRLSLAGAQHKTAVLRFEDGTLAVPMGATASTHILKIPHADWPGLVTLEALAMRALKAAHLDAADVAIVRHSGAPCLLITRYDRTHNGVVADRIHQEDICQALGFAPEHKYAEHNGPTLTDVFNLVREHGADPTRLIRLTQRIVASAALGDADAHGKNMSLLLRDDGTVDLAPAYDVVPTGLFEDLDRTLAMPIGTATTLDDIPLSAWDELAETVRLRPSLVRSILKQTARALAEALPNAGKALVEEGANAAVIECSVPWLVDRAMAIADGAPVPPPPQRRAKAPRTSTGWTLS